MFNDKSNVLFIILGGFFIGNAIIIGVKIFSLEETLGFEPASLSFFGENKLSFNLTAGVLLWPVVFIMTDIINEYYGIKGVKFLSFLAVGLISYAFVMIYTAIHLTPNEWWDTVSGITDDQSSSLPSMNLAFSRIFRQGLWIVVGSLVAFLVGQILDVILFQRLRSITQGRMVWLRATGSTLISQLVDSFVVLIIAFYIGAEWELSRVLAIGTVNYIYKFLIAISLTPVIYLAHFLIDNYLGFNLAQKLKTQASAQ